ncbi:MAG TPA: TonB-dependent receptor [Oligoflexus sp.]|uniref:TonB-dependent receptor n=1 Tax=Oligoflexus sp. TaxID=1971216 RepID=UPI002D6F7BDB|nr:TonB-dependent receptor [Oligoflexus sp.]HYX36762.1 TonB-dependent receptor [Oligoflexus sp.]
MTAGSIPLRRGITALLISVTICSTMQTSAQAQSSDAAIQKTEPSNNTKAPERFQVTGSRIKRTDVEGVSSIIQIDQEAIQKSGVSTVGELLQNMAVSIDGSYASQTVNDPRGNVTHVNLRGLGPENTLVLLDGRRLPDEGGLGVVDLSMIPMAAVERIEVLKDSASAIYGSDATGGVVNIISKKNFEGSAFYARASRPQAKGGQQTQFSYVNGVVGSNYRVLAALSHRHAEPVFYRDRAWTREGISSFSIPANIGLTTLVKNPETGLVETDDQGNALTKTAYYASANCPADLPRVGRGLCSYNYGNTAAFAPESQDLGFLGNIDYQINDSVSLYSTLRAQQNENLWNMAPNAGSFTIPASTLLLKPSLNLSGQELAPGTNAVVRYRALPWGNRTWEEINQGFGASVGLKGDFAQDWEWNVSGAQSQSRKDSRSPRGFFLEDLVTNNIGNGNFDPFETNLADPKLAALVDQAAYVPTTVNETRLRSFDANATGDIFELPGGAAALAVGASQFNQFYQKTIDDISQTGNVFGVAENKSGGGERTVNAVYAELEMPIFKQLDVQIAARHDQYSDFGSTTNPKLGMKYRPWSRLLVRGNVGTGFKAPTLHQIYNGGSIGSANLYDTPNLNNIPERQDEVKVETYGNKNLQEETSLGYNAGLVADPFDSLSLTVDYWYLKINDIVRPVDAQKALDAAAAGQPLPGIDIIHVNDDSTGPLESIRVPTANLGRSEDSGYDLSGEYRLKFGSNRLSLSSDYSRKIYSKTVPFPGAEQINVLGDRGHPSWRMVQAGNLALGNQSFTLRNSIIGKQRKTPTPEQTGTLASFSTYDAQYAWSHPWNGSVALGALNIFNKDFPKDDTERTGDLQRVSELYSADGRLFYVNINQVL